MEPLRLLQATLENSNVQTPAETGQWLVKSGHFLGLSEGEVGAHQEGTQGLSCSAALQPALAHAIFPTQRQDLSDYLWTP